MVAECQDSGDRTFPPNEAGGFAVFSEGDLALDALTWNFELAPSIFFGSRLSKTATKHVPAGRRLGSECVSVWAHLACFDDACPDLILTPFCMFANDKRRKHIQSLASRHIFYLLKDSLTDLASRFLSIDWF
jgi:hypothetical protein